MLADAIGHGPRATKDFEQRLHSAMMCGLSVQTSTIIPHGQRAKISQHARMNDDVPVTTRLKRLRESTNPKLSIRSVAEVLGLPSSSYAFYEDVKGFKKTLLPVELATSLADLFGNHGIDRSKVLALAGIRESFVAKTEPEQMADMLDAVMISELEIGYSMGGGAEIDDYQVVQKVPVSRAWLSTLTDAPPAMIYVARGDGDSMMPTLLDRDIVIIDRSQTRLQQQDRIWAVVYGGFSMIKRVRALPDGSLQINSDNPSVSPIIASDGEAYILGRVVGIVRRI